MDVKLQLTAAIFALTYLGLALGKAPGLRMDRAGIALVGATLMIVAGLVPLDQAVSRACIDFETLILLFGMMIIVGMVRLSGLLERLGQWTFRWVRSPHELLAVTILMSGLLSAVLVNDIICLALTPIVLHLARRLRFDPLPHLLGLATAANIGSSATITGNPQNMIIGVQSQIPYLRFALKLFPIAFMGLAIDFVVIAAVCRSRLRFDRELARSTPALANTIRQFPGQRRLQVRSLAVALVTIVLFFSGLPIALVALGGAAVLLVGRLNPERIYREINWSLLVMFAGLFVVVYGFRIHVVERWGLENWTALTTHPVSVLSVAAVALSNLVSNVPAVMLLEPVLHALPPEVQEQGWLALAMSSTLAGNLTMLGSIANLIVAEVARRDGVVVTFWEYAKVGLPITLLTTGLGVAWLQWAAN